MDDQGIDARVASARADLRTALNPEPPDLIKFAHRSRVRRTFVAGFLGVLVVALAAFAVAARDRDTSANITAGPGSVGANADLLAPGAVRPLAPSPLSGRSTMAAVWTGSEMLVWGGDGPSGQLDDGAAYDPRTDLWRLLPPAPLSARNAPAAVWTGEEMLLWGGASGEGSHADGAAYNPTTRRWRTIAPAPFSSDGRPVAVWTGSEMVVLAGFNSSSAAAYDPDSNRWRPLPDLPGHLQAPNPVAAWTGSRVFTVVQPGGTELDSTPRIASLDPVAGQWVDAPAVGQGQVVLAWTGDALVAAAGGEALNLNGDQWNTIAEAPARYRVGDAAAVWTGTQLLLVDVDDVSMIDLDRGTWQPIAAGHIGSRTQPAALWADGVLLVWGGFPDQATGEMLRPVSSGAASDSSPATTARADAPSIDLRTVSWSATAFPLGCDDIGVDVLQVEYAEPSPGTQVAIVMVACSAGAGSPPRGVFVFDSAATDTAPHLLQTLSEDDATRLTGSIEVHGDAVDTSGSTYSSANVPRCCPDGTFTARWRWSEGSYVPTN